MIGVNPVVRPDEKAGDSFIAGFFYAVCYHTEDEPPNADCPNSLAFGGPSFGMYAMIFTRAPLVVFALLFSLAVYAQTSDGACYYDNDRDAHDVNNFIPECRLNANTVNRVITQATQGGGPSRSNTREASAFTGGAPTTATGDDLGGSAAAAITAALNPPPAPKTLTRPVQNQSISATRDQLLASVAAQCPSGFEVFSEQFIPHNGQMRVVLKYDCLN